MQFFWFAFATFDTVDLAAASAARLKETHCSNLQRLLGDSVLDNYWKLAVKQKLKVVIAVEQFSQHMF